MPDVETRTARRVDRAAVGDAAGKQRGADGIYLNTERPGGNCARIADAAVERAAVVGHIQDREAAEMRSEAPLLLMFPENSAPPTC